MKLFRLLLLSLLALTIHFRSASAQTNSDAPLRQLPNDQYMIGVRTNAPADLLLVPNLGVEVPLYDAWSGVFNWYYTWWKNDVKHYYWRIYGGDLEIRYWLGKRSQERRLLGHHLGVYGQMVSYDLEKGAEGVLGDRWTYGGGVAYGYTARLSRHLYLDMSIGAGYLTGTYKRYIPTDDCYRWQSTHALHYWGPTKAEISLVWILNNRKGGKR